MRLTTLLDSTQHTGSGRWGTVTTPAAEAVTTAGPLTSTDVVTAPTGAGEDRRAFDALVAGLLPCRTNDPELWFAERTAEVERAKALCQDCPLVAGCLAGAVDRQEPWGVWGGQVFVDGVVVATKRGRGRPRKDAPAA